MTQPASWEHQGGMGVIGEDFQEEVTFRPQQSNRSQPGEAARR